ncbi:MAG: citramalate synthase [Candidatus Marinimicrobia bacterium]|nr:citramalate synthase [Candidatus Neomarinimicrobiota bacterium]MBL7009594.1 citramalate synthase [Candidatus Neomarinimicrobiota bacterium]MBL7029663.1 citramalate synthase [Candidatus Neomarinimicrobiota bacterium]
MNRNPIEIFDTTLRDGTQGEGVTLSVKDKVRIAIRLDEFGVDFIEGGWPGSNPKDESFFKEIRKEKLHHSRICAFGSTARFPDKIKSDANLISMLRAETAVVSIFGKTWRLHSEMGLELDAFENESLIYESIRHLKSEGRQVIFDAEHFFDGYKDDQEFALRMIQAAEKANADTIVLCETNGGSLPSEITEIVTTVKQTINTPLGVHAHNDSELAVSNTLAAVEAGVGHVQGTINGVGERCGNANLISIIPNLTLKMGFETAQKLDLTQLSSLSHFVSEVMNFAPDQRAAFVGRSAFAHKGGIHVSAVMKNSAMYEHIEPEKVGSQRRVLVSDLSGQSNIRYKASELDVKLNGDKAMTKKVVDRIKVLEHAGYQFDGAEASFELILQEELGVFQPFFDVLDSRINVNYGDDGHTHADAMLKVRVDGEIEHTIADGVGPVNALNLALKKALVRFYPEIKDVKLVDYKVRVLEERAGTESKVRVLIESRDGEDSWSTVGVSENIIEASWQALRDSFNYRLYMTKKKSVCSKEIKDSA